MKQYCETKTKYTRSRYFCYQLTSLLLPRFAGQLICLLVGFLNRSLNLFEADRNPENDRTIRTTQTNGQTGVKQSTIITVTNEPMKPETTELLHDDIHLTKIEDEFYKKTLLKLLRYLQKASKRQIYFMIETVCNVDSTPVITSFKYTHLYKNISVMKTGIE